MSTTKHRFFVRPDGIAEDRIVFPVEEARHAVKVLRLAVGDRVTVVDGAGGTYEVELETVTSKGMVARILSREKDLGESSFYVHAAVGLLKQASRWETFLEKAVELGVSRITPLVSARMQKESFNRRRAEAILIAALKQSGRSRLPTLDEPTSFNAVLADSSSLNCKIICHEASQTARRLGLVLESASASVLKSAPGSVQLLIGPEGGFTDEEVRDARNAGWEEVWLGARRLRTETAAITALSVITQYLDEHFPA